MYRRSNSRLRVFSLFIFLLFLAVTGVTVFLKINQKAFVGKPIWPVSKVVKVQPPEPPSELRRVMESSLMGTEGTYAVVVKNLQTGEGASINGERVFPSASIYKLWVMAAVYEQVQLGKMSLDDSIKEDIASLNDFFDIPEEEAELTEGSVSFTVESALYQMITISHNYAALSLTKKIGLANLNTFLEEYGLFNIKVGGEPTITAADVTLFLEKLYNGKVVSEEASKKMITTMIDQTKNERIPKYLPNGTKIAHKTGELGGVAHDAGIVFSEKGDYIIVLLSDSTSPVGAMDREALVSKAVWDYFQSKVVVEAK